MNIYDFRVSNILHALNIRYQDSSYRCNRTADIFRHSGSMSRRNVSQKPYYWLILSIKLCILTGYLQVFKVDRGTS